MTPKKTRKQLKPLKAKIAPDHPFFEIIEDAYLAFNYPTPSDTGVCKNCCLAPEIEADFFRPIIEEMPLHYLQEWYHAAYTTGGVTKATWAYLLPRILEALAVDEEVCVVGAEITLQRFQSGNREHWNDEEWAVLDRFQRAYLEREAGRETEYLDDTICMFVLGGWPMEALVEQVMALPDDVLASRFWHDWCRGRPGIWLTAFWEDEAKILEFYTSPELYARMEALACSPETEKVLAEKALDVASLIVEHADWA